MNEAEEFDAAVDEAVKLVEEGDKPLVAVDYVAREQRDLSHRFWDILEDVRQEVDTDD